MFESYITGFLVSGGLIIAIGAQNAYLLSQAIRREHHWPVAFICMVCDASLIALGMFGVSTALAAVPQALEFLRWMGVIFLTWLALQAAMRVWRGRAALSVGAATPGSLRKVILTTLAVSLLNPQVYLDTLLLVPAIGVQQSSAVAFVVGACTSSFVWFSLLAWSGSALAPVLSRPLAWRIIDGLIGLMMAAIALQLAFNSGL